MKKVSQEEKKDLLTLLHLVYWSGNQVKSKLRSVNILLDSFCFLFLDFRYYLAGAVNLSVTFFPNTQMLFIPCYTWLGSSRMLSPKLFLLFIKFGLLFVAEIKRLRAWLKRSQGFTTPSRSVLRALNVEGEIPRLHSTQLYARSCCCNYSMFILLSILLLVGLSCWDLKINFSFIILFGGLLCVWFDAFSFALEKFWASSLHQ